MSEIYIKNTKGLSEEQMHITKLFDRVIINEQGDVVPPAQAVDVFNIYPDVAFLRDDGWSLAAPLKYEGIAYTMWSDKWTHFTRKPARRWVKITVYTLSRESTRYCRIT